MILLNGSGLASARAVEPPRMSVTEAQQFALTAVPLRQRKLPGFQFDLPKTDKGLYVFDAIWNGLPNGSVEIGFYAVDPVTGAVWNAVMGCEQVSTPELKKLQTSWIKHSGLAKGELLKFQAPGPQCPNGKD
ncbi:MAG TPA: hypothetical protein VN678_11180 [Acidobacteriaceae bacterium]|nr:hypothetical protein [Acidobacteriaceae bacterium]